MDAPESRVAIGRLRIRSRRGMKELDVLLERYLERRIAAADAAERDDYARLLEEQDPALAAYLLKGETPADPAVARAVTRVLEAAKPRRA